MTSRTRTLWLCCLALILLGGLPAASMQVRAQPADGLVKKFPFGQSGLHLDGHSQVGSFFDVVGRKSAVFGYENRSLEAWVYPLKIIDDFNLSFQLQGYPLDIRGPDITVGIEVRPEA